MFCWNWADFLITVIGSFLGIIAAILTAVITNKIIENKQRKTILRRLKSDLEDILSNYPINDINSKIASGFIDYKKLINLPYFQNLVSSEQFSLLGKLPYCNKLLRLNSVIIELNEWYKARTDYYLLHAELINNTTSEINIQTTIFNDLGNVIIDEYAKFRSLTKEIFEKI